MARNTPGQNFMFTVGVVVLVIAVVGVGMAILPKYNVYRRTLRGQAALQEAEWDRQIRVEEAQAEAEAAVLLADAEVARAVGVAEANQIIGESLKENEAYLRYLWVIGLHDGSSEVIYVPTEANLPMLEARDNRMGGGR